MSKWTIAEGGSCITYDGFGKNVLAFFGTRNMDDEALFSSLGITDALFAKQVHGTDILVADGRLTLDEWVEEGRKGYDGLLINLKGRKGWAAAVYTADCVPVLLYDGKLKVACALHAGWKGTAAEIARRGVETMVQSHGSKVSDISAAIGPSIGHCCYQVDSAVYNVFRLYPWKKELFREDGERWRLDLKEANRRQLMESGVPEENIGVANFCTACRQDMFYSYRLEGSTGRMVSGILMR